VVEVKFRRLTKGNLKAFASVKFNNGFVIDGMRIISGSKGTFVAWPSQEYTDKNGDKKYKAIVACEDEELFKSINKQILAEFGSSRDSGSSNYGGSRKPSYSNRNNNNDTEEDDGIF